MLHLEWRIPCLIRVLPTVVGDRNLEADRRARLVQELHGRDLAAEVGAVALLEHEMEAHLADDQQPHQRLLEQESLTFRVKRTMADNSWYRALCSYFYFTI